MSPDFCQTKDDILNTLRPEQNGYLTDIFKYLRFD